MSFCFIWRHSTVVPVKLRDNLSLLSTIVISKSFTYNVSVLPKSRYILCAGSKYKAEPSSLPVLSKRGMTYITLLGLPIPALKDTCVKLFNLTNKVVCENTGAESPLYVATLPTNQKSQANYLNQQPYLS